MYSWYFRFLSIKNYSMGVLIKTSFANILHRINRREINIFMYLLTEDYPIKCLWDWLMVGLVHYINEVDSWLSSSQTGKKKKKACWLLVLSVQRETQDELCSSHRLTQRKSFLNYQRTNIFSFHLYFSSQMFFLMCHRRLRDAKVLVTRGRCNHKLPLAGWSPWDRWKGKQARKLLGPISCQKSQW